MTDRSVVLTRIGLSAPPFAAMVAEAARTGRGPSELRMSPEAALLVGAVGLALGEGALKGIDRSAVGLAMAADCGAMANYEAFARAAAAGTPRSGAFVHAIPSAPPAMVALTFGFKGPAVTLSGGAEAAADAAAEAARWVADGVVEAAVAGAWRSPSDTAAAERGWSVCAAVAGVIETEASAAAGGRPVLARYREGGEPFPAVDGAPPPEGAAWLNGTKAPGDG